MRFRHELSDFIRFLRHPRLSPRLPQQQLGQACHTDWVNGLGVKRLLQWALFLWFINITVFGPVAALVATSAGAQHKLDLSNVPWMQAIFWAPLAEELVFRYVLRRPAQSIWVVPLALWCLFTGPQTITVVVLLSMVLWLIVRPTSLWRWPWRWQRVYVRHFGWVLYLSTVLFAGLHLYNFQLNQLSRASLLMLPLLILPQFVTGLVLAWLRVRRGIGASIVLHAIFNSGPILVILIIYHLII